MKCLFKKMRKTLIVGVINFFATIIAKSSLEAGSAALACDEV